ncbi:hypothetical protein BY458DRAFT_307806 [Sporodiniella umbellata]|nr:hypothetical protein BY458DRAFT_307806 [Sporodiniella umbellata]
MSTLFDYFGKKNEKKEKATTTTTTTAKSHTVLKAIGNDSLKRKSVNSTVIEQVNKEAIRSIYAGQKGAGATTTAQQSTERTVLMNSPSRSMINTCKFNKKAWAPIDSRRAPLRSSQEPGVTRPSAAPVNKVRLHTQKSVSQPRYDWLGENDVKPYSSSCVQSKKNLGVQRPNILPYSLQTPSVAHKKRKLDVYLSPGDQHTSRALMRSMTSTAPSNARCQRLSAEQQAVLDLVSRDQKSLFFTGSAGTGKSVLLRAMIDALGTMYGAGLAVTASTGIAAININGCTLHR